MQGRKACNTETSASSCQGNRSSLRTSTMATTGVLCCFRASSLALCIFSCLLLAGVPSSLVAAQDPSKLSLEYYSKTCPNVEHVVRTEMECAVRADTRNAALMLRLHFHDCFVQVSHPQSVPSVLAWFTSYTDQTSAMGTVQAFVSPMQQLADERTSEPYF